MEVVEVVGEEEEWSDAAVSVVAATARADTTGLTEGIGSFSSSVVMIISFISGSSSPDVFTRASPSESPSSFSSRA